MSELEITAFGEVGEAVEGTFNVNLHKIPSATGGGATSLALTYPVEGSFRVERIDYTLPIYE
jgi:hypothetical protein